MPITTEYANFDKKAFFDNREWLNQENWQMYFGGSLPSGVLVNGRLETDGVNYTSALSRQVLSNNYIGFRPGSVLVNGIFASYIGGTSIPNIKSADIDRLFVARVYNTAGNVKIVGMTKVAAEYGYTPSVFAKMLLQDESLGCTRNETVYDIPLCYEVFGNYVYDLRRLIYLPGKAPDVEILFSHNEVTNTATIPDILYGRDFIQIYGGMNYNVNFSSDDTTEIFYIYPNPACSEKQAVVKLINASSVTKQIRIPLQWKNLDFSYSWLESWTADPNNQYLYKELIAGDKTTMIFVPNGHKTAFDYTVSNKSSISGGGIDPDEYYTKQEIVDQLLLKANKSDVEEEMATKEDIDKLGSLAYQSEVNYASQIINKPTLGALASKDKTTLTSDVTGVLPVVNGGTGVKANPSMLVNLASTSAADVLAASPRPGVTGVLPIANGGTGIYANPSMLINLGSTSEANVFAASPRPGITGILSQSHGGTGTNSISNLIQSEIQSYFNETLNYSGTKLVNLNVPYGKHYILNLTGNTSLSGADNNLPTITVDGGILEIVTNGRSLTVASNSSSGCVVVKNGGSLISTGSGSININSTGNNSRALVIDTCGKVNITTNLSCSSKTWAIECKSFAVFQDITTSQHVVANGGIIIIRGNFSYDYAQGVAGGIVAYGGLNENYGYELYDGGIHAS